MNQQFLVFCGIRIQDKQLNTLVLYGHYMHNFNMHASNTYQWNRYGTIKGTGVSMHYAKSIMILQYIITVEHLPKSNDIKSQV